MKICLIFIIMKALTILRNHPDNSKGWKIFIQFMNITLWLAIADVILLLTVASPDSVWKIFAASLCAVGIMMDMFWLHSIEAPLLSNRRTPPSQRDFIQEDLEAASHTENVSLKDLI